MYEPLRIDDVSDLPFYHPQLGDKSQYLFARCVTLSSKTASLSPLPLTLLILMRSYTTRAGNFLVRKSFTSLGKYTISVTVGALINHYRDYPVPNDEGINDVFLRYPIHAPTLPRAVLRGRSGVSNEDSLSFSLPRPSGDRSSLSLNPLDRDRRTNQQNPPPPPPRDGSMNISVRESSRAFQEPATSPLSACQGVEQEKKRHNCPARNSFVLPLNWMVHISQDPATAGQFFFESPEGEVKTELPSPVYLQLTGDAQDLLRRLYRTASNEVTFNEVAGMRHNGSAEEEEEENVPLPIFGDTNNDVGNNFRKRLFAVDLPDTYGQSRTAHVYESRIRVQRENVLSSTESIDSLASSDTPTSPVGSLNTRSSRDSYNNNPFSPPPTPPRPQGGSLTNSPYTPLSSCYNAEDATITEICPTENAVGPTSGSSPGGSRNLVIRERSNTYVEIDDSAMQQLPTDDKHESAAAADRNASAAATNRNAPAAAATDGPRVFVFPETAATQQLGCTNGKLPATQRHDQASNALRPCAVKDMPPRSKHIYWEIIDVELKHADNDSPGGDTETLTADNERDPIEAPPNEIPSINFSLSRSFAFCPNSPPQKRRSEDSEKRRPGSDGGGSGA